MAAMTVFMVSCEPDNTVEIPTVSFAVQPVNTDGVFTLTLMTTGYNGTDPVTVPLTFSGTAEEFEDYRLSADAFVIGGSEPVGTITVTTLTTVPDKELTISLVAPEGFQLGSIPSVTLALTPVRIYVSFENSSMGAPESATVVINTYDENGELKRVGQAMTVEVEVDTEESTAELGTHFVFDGDMQNAVIGAGELRGSFTLNLVKFEEGHNTVVLNIKTGDNVYAGDNSKVTITFSGSLWTKLGGTWVMNELITDQQYFIDNYMADSYSGEELLPVFNANDNITFDLTTGTFTPEFESSFKDYFIGVSNIKEGTYYNNETSDNMFNGEVLLVELDNVNRYFSSTDVSEDKVGYVGVNFITDDETGEELLDFYVLDFVSHSFFPELEAEGWHAYQTVVTTLLSQHDIQTCRIGREFFYHAMHDKRTE